MKTIEVVFTYDEGLMKNYQRNGVLKSTKTTLNIDHIVSIEEWQGENLHKGRTGTLVTDINGKKHIDDLPYITFISFIKNIKKSNL